MADVRPFAGLRYDPRVVGGLDKVLAPPYDVISPAEQQALHDLHPNNIIRIELGMGRSSDVPGNDRYARAADCYREWLASGALRRDPSPAYYLIRHEFTLGGRRMGRREVMAAVRLEPWDRGVIRPHELTLSGPKADRFSLMQATSANTSPIFCLYPDVERAIGSILDEVERGEPAVNIPEWRGASYRIWTITGDATVAKLAELFGQRPLYIADGHHRYETALSYRQARRAADGDPSVDQAYDFVMMTLTASDDPGLRILPLHRLLRNLESATIASLPGRLTGNFDVSPFTYESPDGIEAQLAAGADGSPAIALAGLEPGKAFLLRPKNVTALRAGMSADLTPGVRDLDVALLHQAILGPLFGYGAAEADAGLLAFSHDTGETLDFLGRGEFQIAFVLNPTRPGQVMTVADEGGKMPQKSTFFYPKLPTGLVMHLLDGRA